MIVEVAVGALLDILELVVLEEKAQLPQLLEQVAVAVVDFMDLMELPLQGNKAAGVAVFSFTALVQMELQELLQAQTMLELVGLGLLKEVLQAVAW
jgi:hypothetical protein